MKRPILLFLFSLVVTVHLTAQRYSFTHYTTNSGLVQTDITDIKQDKKGNIWIGTAGGLSVFDGKAFTNYDDHDLLQSLRINAILCDSNGAVWIATHNGLLKYETGFRVFFKPSQGRNNYVSSLTTDAQNNLFFVCNDTLFRVKNGRVEKVHVNNQIESHTAFAAFDRDDQLWIITTDLKVYRKVYDRLTPIRTPFTQEELKHGLGFIKLLGKEAPEPYFVTNFGALRVNGDSLQFFVHQYPQYSKARVGQATYVLEESDSSMWVGGVAGLSKITGKSAVRYATENGFCDNSVSCLFTDRERNLWIGCTYNGVYKLSNEALFHLKPANESFDLRHVYKILPVSAQKTLIGTWGKGLYLYGADSVSKVALPSYVRYITSLLPAGRYTYLGWFGPGLWRLNNATLEVTRVKSFVQDEAIDMMARLGNEIVVQMLDRNCYLTDSSFRIKASTRLPEEFYLTVLQNKIYRVSPFGQVDLLDKSFGPVQKNIFPEISSRITEIAFYRDHFLIGTFGQGLFMYNQWGKLVRKLDKKTGLTTNIVTSLLADGDRVYIGSNLGLIRAGLPGLQNVKVFTEGEGMFNWECRRAGLQKMPDGAIMVATTNGPYVYYPLKDSAAHYASAVLTVAGIRYGENALQKAGFSPFDKQIQLPAPIEFKDNQVTVALNGVSQRAPDGIRYHYQLSGYDSMWVTTADPVLSFTSLAPGTYKLKAYATVDNFQSKLITVGFSVAKPLSGQLWFQILLVLLLSGLCWILLTIGNRVYQKYIQSKMVGKLEADMALKQKLTAQTVSFAQQHYKELGDALRQHANTGRLENLTPVFLKDIGNRINLLWRKDTLTLSAFHEYFDELLADYSTGARLYHKPGLDGMELPVAPAFQLLQIFSLYVFVGLYENGTAVFGLDSENRSNGRLLMRLYNLTHESGPGKAASYQLLKDAASRYQNGVMTVDVIENLEFGNMVVAELNLHNEN